MIRIFFRCATALSLLVCAAAITFWVRSYSGSDYMSRMTLVAIDSRSITHEERELSCTRGQIRWGAEEYTYISHQPITDVLWQTIGTTTWSHGRLGVGHVGWESPTPRSFWNRLGFDTWQDGMETSFSSSSKQVRSAPAWLAVLVFAIPPGLWLLRRLRRRRTVGEGRCAVCGYDLRATPERCPECGTMSGA